MTNFKVHQWGNFSTDYILPTITFPFKVTMSTHRQDIKLSHVQNWVQRNKTTQVKLWRQLWIKHRNNCQLFLHSSYDSASKPFTGYPLVKRPEQLPPYYKNLKRRAGFQMANHSRNLPIKPQQFVSFDVGKSTKAYKRNILSWFCMTTIKLDSCKRQLHLKGCC